jgi:2-dehydro-3-deoxyphosphogluconate aldolase/(4S)-4-hydroxy-2-oxoglutarate aldolase
LKFFGALNKIYLLLAELPGMILGVSSVTDAAAASLYAIRSPILCYSSFERRHRSQFVIAEKYFGHLVVALLTEIARAEEFRRDCGISWNIYGPQFVKEELRLPVDKHNANRRCFYK